MVLPSFDSTNGTPPTAAVAPAVGRLPAAPSALPYRWRGLASTQRGAIFAGWLALGLIETARVVANPTSIGVTSIPWDHALVGNFPWWFAWAILTPLVFSLADALRLDTPRGWRSLPLLVVGGIGVIGVHLPMALALWYLTNPLPQVRLVPFAVSIRNIAVGAALLEMLTFAATVGLFYALDANRRLHFGELASARLAARASELEASVVEARLEALRLQLSPHFLFNALNSVAGLIRGNEPAVAVSTISSLGELLRVTLATDRTRDVPLHVELQHLDLYLAIERQRFRDRLTVDFAIAPAARDCLVPVLFLQPLVENAVKHGVSKRPGAALVRVEATLDDAQEHITIAVEDDGPGFPPRLTAQPGIGLSNTRARIAQLYGERGRVEVRSLGGRGARVAVTIPIARRPVLVAHS